MTAFNSRVQIGTTAMNRHTTTRPRVAQIVPQTKHKAHIETHTRRSAPPPPAQGVGRTARGYEKGSPSLSPRGGRERENQRVKEHGDDDDVQQALEAAFNNTTPFVPTAITVRGQKYNVSRSASGGFEQTHATDPTKVREVRRVARRG